MNIYSIGAVVLILAGLIGAVVWQTQRLAESRAIQEAQTQAIKIYAGEMERANTARLVAEDKMQAARDAESRDMEVFNVHDIIRDIQEKPGLVANRATAAYGRLFDHLAGLSRSASKTTSAEAGRHPGATD